MFKYALVFAAVLALGACSVRAEATSERSVASESTGNFTWTPQGERVWILKDNGTGCEFIFIAGGGNSLTPRRPNCGVSEDSAGFRNWQ